MGKQPPNEDKVVPQIARKAVSPSQTTVQTREENLSSSAYAQNEENSQVPHKIIQKEVQHEWDALAIKITGPDTDSSDINCECCF